VGVHAVKRERQARRASELGVCAKDFDLMRARFGIAVPIEVQPRFADRAHAIRAVRDAHAEKIEQIPSLARCDFCNSPWMQSQSEDDIHTAIRVKMG
jgi:hypothetical protein